ncbi:hypothetical protein DITRI_Ditri10aG0054600 [Diplodiscus trichospermus]
MDDDTVREGKEEYNEQDQDGISNQEKGSSSESFNSSCMSKRHYECDLDDYAKPCKERDEQVDAITLPAQALVSHWKKLNGFDTDGELIPVDNLQIALLLALSASDHLEAVIEVLPLKGPEKLSKAFYLKLCYWEQ